MSQILPPNGENPGNGGRLPGASRVEATDGFPPYGAYSPSPPGEGGFPWRRYVAALLRYKWVIAVALALGVVGAAGVFRAVDPEYTARGSLWIQSDDTNLTRGGPIAPGGLLESYAWLDLLRSGQVLDSVAYQYRLFVIPGRDVPRSAFQNLILQEDFQPDQYVLQISETGESWVLSRKEGTPVDQGRVGDPVGGAVGFRWMPPGELLVPGRDVPFHLSTPGDARRDLDSRLASIMDLQGNFIRLSLSGTDPSELAAILNSIMERHVKVSADLKRLKLDERVRTLEDQLARVEVELAGADQSLERFRVNTITLPSDASTPISAGLEITRDPVIDNFHRMRLDLVELQRDRNRLSEVLANLPSSGIRVEALEIIPATARSSQLTRTLEELIEARSDLRGLLNLFTEAHPEVIRTEARIARLEQDLIPAFGRQLLSELDSEITDLNRLVESAGRELSEIPARSIEEAQLVRRQASAATLYGDVRQRFEESRLAAASSIPDVTILDRATQPRFPSSDQRMRLAVIVLLGSLGAGLAGAVLLDRMDPKVRYPTQVTSELGMEILGAIPWILPQNGRKSSENREQVLESFRELRLNLEFAHGAAGPVLLALSSPGPGEGKTLISTNLAMAFAEMGRRTLLVDADTRRGDAERLVGRERKPGLTDYLMGRLSFGDLVQATDYPGLDFIGSGSRVSNSPELLATPEAQRLLARLRPSYDVIVVDSPPLGAGSDAFILGALTGNLVLVLRNGTSDRVLTRARLEPLARLPIRVLGAVLNDTGSTGVYRYYGSYLPGYGASDEAEDETTPKALKSAEAG